MFTATLLLHVAVVFAVRDRGWDDGAITMAFADTFAQTGRMSITPPSEVIEGFSSPAWLLLLAGVYRVFPLAFGGMILAAQLLTALFAALGATLLWDLLRPFLPRVAMLFSIAVFCYGPFLLETANGMEMTALSAAVLALLRSITRLPARTWQMVALAALVPWIRLEAAGYLAVAALALIALSRDYRRAGALVAGAVASSIVLTAVRLALFDSLVPNTIIAKRWPVYGSDTFLGHLRQPVLDLLYVLAPGMLLTAVILAARRPSLRHIRARIHPAGAFIVGYVMAVGIFNLGIGYNWGYPGRMEQSAIALAVVLVCYTAPVALRSVDSVRHLIPILIAMAVLSYVGVFVGDDQMTKRWPTGRADDTTPADISETGRALDDLRVRLGLPTMSVLLPDVGGSSLCCQNLQVMDLGMLASRELARDGYQAAGDYVEEHRPDVIVDPSWGAGSLIYDTSYFSANYVPITTGDNWFYLRTTHFAELEPQCSWISTEDAKPLWHNPDGYTERYLQESHTTTVCLLR